MKQSIIFLFTILSMLVFSACEKIVMADCLVVRLKKPAKLYI